MIIKIFEINKINLKKIFILFMEKMKVLKKIKRNLIKIKEITFKL